MSKPLSKKEKDFAKEYSITGNATQAVKDIFEIKDTDYAGVKGHRLIRKDKVKNVIKSIADSIPDELVSERHIELLNKRDTFIIKDTETGEVKEKIDLGPETMAVSKGIDMAYKVKGTYAPEKNIQLFVEPLSLEELTKAQKYDDWYNQQP